MKCPACAFENPEVWVGYLPQQFATAHMVRLDGATGTIKETVVIPDWTIGSWTDYGPYGAALDKNLDVWFVGLRGALYRVNASEDPATSDRWIPENDYQIYGMTVDPDGDPWFGPNCGDIMTFDAATEKFIAVAGTNACHRGLAADKNGSVWVADNSECGVWQVDHKTNTLIKFHKLEPCGVPVGVSVDLIGEPRVARGDHVAREHAVFERPRIARSLEAEHVRGIDADPVHPGEASNRIGRRVHGRSLERVPCDLLLAENRADAWRKQHVARRPLALRYEAEQIADLRLHRALGHGVVRQPFGQLRVVGQPGPTRLEVRVHVDDHVGTPCSSYLVVVVHQRSMRPDTSGTSWNAIDSIESRTTSLDFSR